MSRLFVSFILVASALAAAAPPASAASLLVCSDSCPYTTIQSAINAASNGDTIVVQPGTYSQALTVDKDVTLCSTMESGTTCDPNPNGVTIDGAGQIYPIFITASGVTIQGFTIQNPTFTTTDQTLMPPGRVDPSLVVVYGVDNVQIVSSILQFPASPLAPGTSRWITDGINVAEDAGGAKSDNLRISGNIFRYFTESVGAGGQCANAPCRMAAIDLWGVGAAPRITWNNMLLPTGQPDDATVARVYGIYGNAANAVIRGNVIQAEALTGLYGIKGAYSNSDFLENSFYNSLHGVFVSGSNNEFTDNVFSQNNEGLRLTTCCSTITGNQFLVNSIGVKIAAPNGGPEATSLVFRENLFTDNTRAVSIHQQVSNVAFDMRENDWGVYEADQIRLFLEDAGTGNSIDISCFIDEDHTTRVCPDAIIDRVVSGTAWPRTVTLTDASTFDGSEFGSRLWTLPSGTSTASPVVLTLSPGPYTVGLTVEDANGFQSSTSDSFILSNTAPAFDIADAYSVAEGALLTVALNAVDTDALTYTLLPGAPAGLAIVGGDLKWTPTATQAGVYTVSVRVSDGADQVTDTTTITVTDVPVGPVFDPATNLNVLEGETKVKNVKANAPGNSPVVLTKDSGPGTFVDNGNGQGTLTFSAASGSAGVYPVVISATSEGITNQLTFNVVVTSAVGLTFTKVTPSIVQSSPGATVQITGTLKNTGTGADAFKVTAVSSKTGYTIGSVADVPLAAGATSAVSVPVTLPANADTTQITIKICSVASPTTCATQKWRVDVPLVISLVMEPEFGALDTIGGTVVVKFLDGAVAQGVAVIVTEASDEGLPLFESMVQGSTDPTGTFAFTFDNAQAKLLGGHSVFVSAQRVDTQYVKTGHYDIVL